MPIEYFVYCLTNQNNGKRYIGSTKNLTKRMRAHRRAARSGGGYAIHAAIRKHGWEAFSQEVLASVQGLDNALIFEAVLIDKYGSFIGTGHGYNMTRGGEGHIPKKGGRLTPEHRQKISDATREAMQDPALREFLSKHSAEWLAANPDHHDKMLAGAEAQRQSSEYETTRQKMSTVSKANFTDESLVKMQEGARLYWKGDASLERRRRMAELMATQRPLGQTSWNKGRAWTDEEKARQSQAHLGKTASAATKAKIAESAHQRAVARKEAGLPARRTGLVKLSDATKALIGQKAQRYSDETFSEIYRRRQAGERTSTLAQEYGMAVTTVSSIGSGKHPRMAKLLVKECMLSTVMGCELPNWLVCRSCTISAG